MDPVDLDSRLRRAMQLHERQTGFQLNPEYFELHVSQGDWIRWISQIGAYGLNGTDPKNLFGIKVITDREVQDGQGELVCTWKCIV